MVGKAFQVEGTASTKASGGNEVSKRKRGGEGVRKARGSHLEGVWWVMVRLWRQSMEGVKLMKLIQFCLFYR